MLVHSVCDATWEGNVQDISLVMSTVSSNTVAKACRCKGNGGFSNEGRAVIAVSVAPDAIELQEQVSLPSC